MGQVTQLVVIIKNELLMLTNVDHPTLNEAYLILSKELHILSASPRYMKLVGISQNLRGRNFLDIHPDAANSLLISRLSEASPDLREFVVEDYSPILKLWFEYRVTAYEGGFAILILDITTKKLKQFSIENAEDEARRVLEGSATGIAHMGLDRRWHGMNPRFAEILGIESENFSKSDFQSFTLATDADSDQRNLTALIRGERNLICSERQLLKPDGSLIWVNTKLSLVRDAKGPQFFVVTLDDIAETKEIEESLQFALEAADVGSWDYHAIENTTRRSPRFDQIYGCQECTDDWGYQDFLKNVHPEDLDSVEKTFQQALASGNDFSMQYRIEPPEQGLRWISLRGRVYMNRAGRANRMAGIAIDITSEKVWEQHLEDAKRIAEEANREKSNFLANMSHEIRTPLGAILGFSELMLEPELDRIDLENYLTIINRNGKNLSLLIDDIIDLSKVESGNLQIEQKDVVILDMIKSIEALFELKADSKGLKVIIKSEGQVPEKVGTDPTRLRQILLNIVGNAIKFTQSGQIEILIRSFPVNEGSYGEIAFYVSDTGLGITAEQKARLFQPFVQADSSTTREFGGTGLGLALARKFARALGGDVILDHSEPGRGSTFKITIAAIPPKIDTTNEFALASSPTDSSAESNSGIHILVADDSPDNRLLISRILNKTGAHIELANDGGKALEKARRTDYDIVVMDMQMPNVDGYEATRQLRDGGFLGPIIALTANAMRNDREKCLRAGCSDYLAKPIDPALLYKVVGDLIQKSSSK